MDLVNKRRQALWADMLYFSFERQTQKWYLLIRAIAIQAGMFVHEILQIGEWAKFTMIKTYRNRCKFRYVFGCL